MVVNAVLIGRRSVRRIDTPIGPARATVLRPTPATSTSATSTIATSTADAPTIATSSAQAAGPGAAARGTLILGHGAGGSGPSRDLIALTGLTRAGWVVVLVDQPWRVAGRRVAGPPAQLDVAWTAAWRALTRGGARALPRPYVAGGRSAGARVVARTAADLGPEALLLLSFPLVPPGRDAAASRAPELARAVDTGVPLLVVQGRTDTFGRPPEVAQAAGLELGRQVVPVRGGHGMSGDAADVAQAVRAWLDELPASAH